eukprot:8109252-Lingulodinium_polyedra.AAC.1
MGKSDCVSNQQPVQENRWLAKRDNNNCARAGARRHARQLRVAYNALGTSARTRRAAHLQRYTNTAVRTLLRR